MTGRARPSDRAQRSHGNRLPGSGSVLSATSPFLGTTKTGSVARLSKLRDPSERAQLGREISMTDEASVSERWYDANDIGGRNAFFRDLGEIFRKNHPREPFGEDRRRLWQLIEKHGGSLDGRPTWLRIVSETIDKDTVEVRQTQEDGAYKLFNLTAAETRELLGTLVQ